MSPNSSSADSRSQCLVAFLSDPGPHIVAADIALLAKTQTPLAIKTREESITSIEKFEEFGLARMCHHPATTTHKEAVLVRELIHQPAAHYPMKPN